MEKVLITPLSHSLGVSRVLKPSDSTSMVLLALLGSEGLFAVPETPSPSLLRDGRQHTHQSHLF